eukprot:CAMPEP_0202890064 /NCGR_PEP_ID=MMETSP1392-20130828/579_1 /ASSEMBLY_ACC=CAM_ASM_000868 /TAXON_ID=225041 /ORGANISM="Chlamydomonas chlamydogama, Strain SAG 11-48b" /LENGTH=100 /DNA_ID=CAMNT_0049573549 /DNA_START=949 /DNA_END=1251 /DNA_ORIENTATION=-
MQQHLKLPLSTSSPTSTALSGKALVKGEFAKQLVWDPVCEHGEYVEKNDAPRGLLEVIKGLFGLAIDVLPPTIGLWPLASLLTLISLNSHHHPAGATIGV